MKNPKFVIIGAGSIFFTRAVVIGMCKDPRYRGGTLALVDVDPAMLDVMRRLCERIIRECDADLTVEATTERCDVLPNADFVVLSYSVKGVDMREIETVVPARFGVTQSSGDTTGPGGLFRALRSIPGVLEVARDIERLCPEAWVFNYINPTTMIGAALFRNTNLKVLALCDGVIMPQKKWSLMKRVGVPVEQEQDVVMKIGGINHFSWVTEFRHGDRDLMPALLESLRKDPEERANRAVMQILEVFGFYSAVGGHMIEFLPWFQGHGSNPAESHTLRVFEIEERRKWMRSFNEDIRAQADGSMPVSDLIDKTKPDLAIRIANSVIDNDGGMHYVNFPNRGHISNLPENAVIELPARIYADRYEAEPFGEMPPILRGWLLRVIDTQETALEAIRTQDRSLLRRALVNDPLTVSIEDAEHIIDALFEAEKDDIPDGWF